MNGSLFFRHIDQIHEVTFVRVTLSPFLVPVRKNPVISRHQVLYLKGTFFIKNNRDITIIMSNSSYNL